MDGRSRQVLVNSNINRPYGLTIDIASQTLYFIDGYYDNIERVNVDGSGRERLLHFRTDIVPYSLVYHNAALYWTERLDRVISMLTLQGETRVLSNVTVTNVRPAGLTLIARERQPEGVCNALRLHNVHVHFRKMESTKEEEASEVKQTTKQSNTYSTPIVHVHV